MSRLLDLLVRGDAVEKRRRIFSLPNGKTVRLIRWKRNEQNVFVVRVACDKDRLELSVKWFDQNAIEITPNK